MTLLLLCDNDDVPWIEVDRALPPVLLDIVGEYAGNESHWTQMVVRPRRPRLSKTECKRRLILIGMAYRLNVSTRATGCYVCG